MSNIKEVHPYYQELYMPDGAPAGNSSPDPNKPPVPNTGITPAKGGPLPPGDPIPPSQPPVAKGIVIPPDSLRQNDGVTVDTSPVPNLPEEAQLAYLARQYKVNEESWFKSWPTAVVYLGRSEAKATHYENVVLNRAYRSQQEIKAVADSWEALLRLCNHTGTTTQVQEVMFKIAADIDPSEAFKQWFLQLKDNIWNKNFIRRGQYWPGEGHTLLTPLVAVPGESDLSVSPEQRMVDLFDIFVGSLAVKFKLVQLANIALRAETRPERELALQIVKEVAQKKRELALDRSISEQLKQSGPQAVQELVEQASYRVALPPLALFLQEKVGEKYAPTAHLVSASHQLLGDVQTVDETLKRRTNALPKPKLTQAVVKEVSEQAEALDLSQNNFDTQIRNHPKVQAADAVTQLVTGVLESAAHLDEKLLPLPFVPKESGLRGVQAELLQRFLTPWQQRIRDQVLQEKRLSKKVTAAEVAEIEDHVAQTVNTLILKYLGLDSSIASQSESVAEGPTLTGDQFALLTEVTDQILKQSFSGREVKTYKFWDALSNVLSVVTPGQDKIQTAEDRQKIEEAITQAIEAMIPVSQDIFTLMHEVGMQIEHGTRPSTRHKQKLRQQLAQLCLTSFNGTSESMAQLQKSLLELEDNVSRQEVTEALQSVITDYRRFILNNDSETAKYALHNYGFSWGYLQDLAAGIKEYRTQEPRRKQIQEAVSTFLLDLQTKTKRGVGGNLLQGAKDLVRVGEKEQSPLVALRDALYLLEKYPHFTMSRGRQHQGLEYVWEKTIEENRDGNEKKVIRQNGSLVPTLKPKRYYEHLDPLFKILKAQSLTQPEDLAQVRDILGGVILTFSLNYERNPSAIRDEEKMMQALLGPSYNTEVAQYDCDIKFMDGGASVLFPDKAMWRFMAMVPGFYEVITRELQDGDSKWLRGSKIKEGARSDLLKSIAALKEPMEHRLEGSRLTPLTQTLVDSLNRLSPKAPEFDTLLTYHDSEKMEMLQDATQAIVDMMDRNYATNVHGLGLQLPFSELMKEDKISGNWANCWLLYLCDELDKLPSNPRSREDEAILRELWTDYQADKLHITREDFLDRLYDWADKTRDLHLINPQLLTEIRQKGNFPDFNKTYPEVVVECLEQISGHVVKLAYRNIHVAIPGTDNFVQFNRPARENEKVMYSLLEDLGDKRPQLKLRLFTHLMDAYRESGDLQEVELDKLLSDELVATGLRALMQRQLQWFQDYAPKEDRWAAKAAWRDLGIKVFFHTVIGGKDREKVEDTVKVQKAHTELQHFYNLTIGGLPKGVYTLPLAFEDAFFTLDNPKLMTSMRRRNPNDLLFPPLQDPVLYQIYPHLHPDDLTSDRFLAWMLVTMDQLASGAAALTAESMYAAYEDIAPRDRRVAEHFAKHDASWENVAAHVGQEGMNKGVGLHTISQTTAERWEDFVGIQTLTYDHQTLDQLRSLWANASPHSVRLQILMRIFQLQNPTFPLVLLEKKGTDQQGQKARFFMWRIYQPTEIARVWPGGEKTQMAGKILPEDTNGQPVLCQPDNAKIPAGYRLAKWVHALYGAFSLEEYEELKAMVGDQDRLEQALLTLAQSKLIVDQSVVDSEGRTIAVGTDLDLSYQTRLMQLTDPVAIEQAVQAQYGHILKTHELNPKKYQRLKKQFETQVRQDVMAWVDQRRKKQR